MIRGLFVGILALLLISTHSQSNTAKFAFSWYEGHCQYSANQGKEECDPTKVALWDHQSFTIHGLWPDSKSKKRYGGFDLTIIEKDAELYDDMQNYWPPKSKKTGSDTFLWHHEWDNEGQSWNRHGHDYAELIYRLQPERFAGLSGDKLNKALQYAFFHDVVEFYKKFAGVHRYPSAKLTKESLAQVLGVKLCYRYITASVIQAVCRGDSEWHFNQSLYSNNFELPDWSDKINQKRVVAYGREDNDI